MNHDEKQINEPEQRNDEHTTKENKITMSLFRFIMIILSAIILTAGITALSLVSGNEKIIDQQEPKRSEFIKLYQVYDTINNDYYTKVNDKKLIDSAIKGMVKGLDDPYSEYMTKDEQMEFTESMSGDFQGIGAELGERDNKIIITSPIKDSPAYKAGIKPNDEIVAVDKKSTKGMNNYDVVKKVRGKKGTTVVLTIKRGNDEPFDVKIKRDTIHVNSVDTKMLKNKVALISVTKFQEGTAEEFHQALKSMHDQGMKKLILDFRNNPGGYLDEAVKMANEFVDKGDVLLYTEKKNSKAVPLKAPNPANPITRNLPTVILLNEGSASASEVFAEALRENDLAKIVGTQSFGKGIVQTTSEFKDKSMFKFTQMKWLTPDEHWIHKKGITPDKEAKLPDYAEIHVLNPDDVYSIGEKNQRIKSLEIGLKALGFNPGKIDDTFDVNTEESVSRFQTKYNLDVTGTMSGKSTEKFTALLRQKLEKNDTQLKSAEQYIGTMK